MKFKINFTGNFWSWFGVNVGLFILSCFTFGLGVFYMYFWNIKYFLDHFEIEQIK